MNLNQILNETIWVAFNDFWCYNFYSFDKEFDNLLSLATTFGRGLGLLVEKIATEKCHQAILCAFLIQALASAHMTAEIDCVQLSFTSLDLSAILNYDGKTAFLVNWSCVGLMTSFLYMIKTYRLYLDCLYIRKWPFFGHFYMKQEVWIIYLKLAAKFLGKFLDK